MLDGDTTVPGTPVVPATDSTDTPVMPPAGAPADMPVVPPTPTIPGSEPAPVGEGEEHHDDTPPTQPAAEVPGAPVTPAPTGLPVTPADGNPTGGDNNNGGSAPA